MRRNLGLILLLTLAVGAGVAQASLTLWEVWSLAPGDRAYLTTDNTQRGMAYNPVTGHVLVANRAGGVSVNVLDANTGADLGSLNVTGIAGGTFALNLIGAGADGAIYGCNLTLNGSTDPFKLYRWADESAAPVLVYQGDPVGGLGAQRWGDTLDVRGSGANTQIVLASRAGTLASVILTDGTNYQAYPVVTDAAAGDIGLGVTFGTGDDFWAKAPSRSLRDLAVDVSVMPPTATTVHSFGLPEIPNATSALDLDPTGTMLLALRYAGDAAAVPQIYPGALLYDISDLANPPVLVGEGLLRTINANLNGTGAVQFGDNGLMYVLGTNNGIAAFAMIPEPGTLALFAAGAALLVWRRRR